MRLIAGHELGLAVAAVAAYLSVLLGGALPLPAWLVVIAPPLAAALKLRGAPMPAASGIALGLAALSVAVVTVVTRGAAGAVVGGTYAVMGLLAARLIARSTYAHDVQALLLALLVVLAGSALNASLSYGLTFLVFAVAAVFTMTTRQLLDSARRTYGESPRLDALRARRDVLTARFLVVTLAITLVVLIATGGVFAAFPRVGLGSLSFLNNNGSQLPDDVALSSGAVRVLGESKMVARVRGVSREAFDRGLYLRGPVYDVLTETGFAKSPQIPDGWFPLAMGPEREVYEVAQQPISGRVLFSLGDVWGVRARAGGAGNPNLRLFVSGQNARGEVLATSSLASALHYEVSGTLSRAGYVPKEPREVKEHEALRAHYLTLPEGIDPRVVALAARLTEGARTDVEKASRIRAHLEGFTYTLEQKPGSSSTPLASFLFEHRTGHCEYFATAYALLLRAAGLPSRVVGGFQGGLFDENERVTVFLGGNAHVWVEWLSPTFGWMTDDATPVANEGGQQMSFIASLREQVLRFWDDTVVDYAFADQRSALRSIAGGLRNARPVLYGAAALAGLGLLVYALRRRRRQKRRRGEKHPIARAVHRLVTRGCDHPPAAAETLREAACRLPLEAPQRQILDEALALYEADRFGAGVPLGRVRAAARTLDGLMG